MMVTRLFKRVCGFTLIELLIVVAIIAILAAIAVPNFLEAQTRAKISRVKNDMRMIATGLEAYMVEYNTYPMDSDDAPGIGNDEIGIIMLTTPVAFLTSMPTDPFYRPKGVGVGSENKYYEMGSGADNTRDGEIRQAWHISSPGPDLSDSTSGNDRFPFRTQIRPYDATNGTKSRGDLYRFGGDYMAGDWTVFGISHHEWHVGHSFPQ